MKLNNRPESEIKEFLDANGLVREYKKQKWRISTIGINTLNTMFRDEFYYWMFINWEAISDLRETNEYYKPTITEEQHQIIIDRYNENPITKGKYKVSDEQDDIRSFENDFIVSEDDFHFTFSLIRRSHSFLTHEVRPISKAENLMALRKFFGSYLWPRKPLAIKFRKICISFRHFGIN